MLLEPDRLSMTPLTVPAIMAASIMTNAPAVKSIRLRRRRAFDIDASVDSG